MAATATHRRDATEKTPVQTNKQSTMMSIVRAITSSSPMPARAIGCIDRPITKNQIEIIFCPPGPRTTQNREIQIKNALVECFSLLVNILWDDGLE